MENIVFTLIERGFGWNLIRSLFATLDSVAFWIFAKVMGLMFDVANFTAESNLSDFIEPLQNRVYVILSIYMLFKVTISLISYIVNPDAMTDKNQGVGKLVQRIIIAMVMLIFFPFAFDKANEIQANIIKDGTIARLVLGTSDSSIDSPEGMGTEIAFSIYNGTFIYDAETKSAVSEGDLTEPTVESLAEVVNEEGTDRSTYKYTYIPLLGFVLGIALTLITLSMCIDVAIRVFKLIILQLVAPIPILSYIDPKASKDGAFSKWIKMVVSVWSELFVRLFIIYFIVLVIEKLLTNGGDLVYGANPFVFIALIIGLLFFAKDAPKFIFDSLGIKAPERGLFAGMGNIMAAGAIGAGAVSGAVSGFSASRLSAAANGKTPNLAKNIGAGLFGGLGGVATGIGAATKAKDHNARAVMEAMSKRNQAALGKGAAGSTFFGTAGESARRLFTGETSADALERQLAGIEAESKLSGGLLDYAEKKAMKSDTTSGTFDGITGNYRAYSSQYAAALNNGTGVFNKYSNGYGDVISQAEYDSLSSAQQSAFALEGQYFSFNGQDINLDSGERIGQGLLDANTQNYIDANPDNDAAITQQSGYFASNYSSKYSTDKSGAPVTSTYKQLKASKGQTAGKKFEIQGKLDKVKANSGAAKSK